MSRSGVILILSLGFVPCVTPSRATAQEWSAFTLPVLRAAETPFAAADSVSSERAQPDPAGGPSLHAPPRGGLARADRLQHLSLSFASGLAIGLASEEPLAAAGGGFGLGLLKELLDARAGSFDGLDLAADALGAALAMLATAALER